MSEHVLSRVHPCRHCGNVAPMEVIGDGWFFEPGTEWAPFFSLLKCFRCHEPVVVRCGGSGHKDDGETYVDVFPAEPKVPPGLPSGIGADYLEAAKLRTSSPNAYGVMLGRVLECICRDKLAKGDTLHKKLEWLLEQGEIPPAMASVAAGIRKLRNIGAHDCNTSLSQEDSLLLDELITVLIQYLYVAPKSLRKLEERLAHHGGAAF